MYKKILLILLTLSTLIQANFFDFQTIEKANQAYKRGDFKESAKLFGSLKKDNPAVAYDRANALYKAGYYDEALSEYAKIKGFNEVDRLHNIGNCYFKKEDYNHAIESYERALKIKEDADTRYNLKLAKKKKREKEKNKKKDNLKKSNPKRKENKKSPKKDKKVKKLMTQKDKIRKKELKQMINRLSKKKMPTLMYRPKLKRGERDDTQNPW